MKQQKQILLRVNEDTGQSGGQVLLGGYVQRVSTRDNLPVTPLLSSMLTRKTVLRV